MLPPMPGPAVPDVAPGAVPRAPAKAFNGETNGVDPVALKLGTGGVAGNSGNEDEQAGASCILEGAGVVVSDATGGIRLGVLANATGPPLGDVAGFHCPLRRGNGNVPGVVSMVAPRGVQGVPGGTTAVTGCMPDPDVVAAWPSTVATSSRVI